METEENLRRQIAGLERLNIIYKQQIEDMELSLMNQRSVIRLLNQYIADNRLPPLWAYSVSQVVSK